MPTLPLDSNWFPWYVKLYVLGPLYL